MASKSVDDNYQVVVAIDFGTAFSGYAFSYRNEQEKITINRNWGHAVGTEYCKTPTCILFNEKKVPVSFGFDAQKEYTELEDGQDKQYYYFEFFKMELHTVTLLTKDKMLTATNGKEMEALTVFAEAIRFLKEHFMKSLTGKEFKDIKPGDLKFQPEEIRWVITVPAIWSYKSKAFMREAALKAGLIKDRSSEKLLIALEPESGSIFCRNLDVELCVDGSQVKGMKLKQGTRYLVLDAGGGTLDVTVHEVGKSNKAKEIHHATGGAHGGIYVDKAFIEFMEDILGKDFLDEFRQNNPSTWLTMMADFEQKKRACDPNNKREKTGLQLLMQLSSIYEEEAGEPIKYAFARKKERGVRISNGMITIKHEAMMKLFKTVIDAQVEHVEELLRIPKLNGIKYILMVGGFSDSKVLQMAIKEAFGPDSKYKLTVMIPQEAVQAVYKGAVIYGHNPSLITERKAKYFYGIKVRNSFDPKKHNPLFKRTDNNDPYCYVFDLKLKQGDDAGTQCTGKYYPTYADQKGVCIEVWYSEEHRNEIRYIDDKDSGLKNLGNVQAPWRGTGLDRELVIELEFGGTEIGVNAITQPGNVKTRADIDCLVECSVLEE